MRIKKALSIVLMLALFLGTGVLSAKEGEIKETVLSNGLKVLTKEIHTSPIVSVYIYYRVGSRNEDDSNAGISHLVEHMLYRTSKKYKSRESTLLISQIGGEHNGFTSKDYTGYYETVPSQYIDLALEIEADRMTGGLFLKEEFEAEKNVVLSELDGDDNDPFALLVDKVTMVAFNTHPYRRPIIGWRDVVAEISREQAVEYYKEHYSPNNAILIIVGDFDTGKIIQQVNKLFGNVKPSKIKNNPIPQEPIQQGERRIILKETANVTYLNLAYHIPGPKDPDYFALDVLDVILSAGKSSIMEKTLVETGIVSSASSYGRNMIDPATFGFYITAKPGCDTDKIEKAFFDMIEKLKAEGISENELQRAKNQVKGGFAYGTEDISRQASIIGSLEIVDSYKQYDNYLNGINKVTADDVKRAAGKYLNRDNMTIGWLIPQKDESGAPKKIGSKKQTDKIESGNVDRSDIKPVLLKEFTWKFEVPKKQILPNKMKLIAKRNPSSDTVAFTLYLNAGSINDSKEKSGLANIVTETIVQSADKASEKLDFLGADINFKCNKEYVAIKGKCLKENFEDVLEIFGDYLINVEFKEEALSLMKEQLMVAIKRNKEKPGSLAMDEFNKVLYTDSNPLSRPVIGNEETIAGIKLKDVKEFYDNHYTPENSILTVVGNIPEDEITSKVRKYLDKWQARGKAEDVKIEKTELGDDIFRKNIAINKPESVIVMGHSGIERNDPEYYAFSVLIDILGSGGDGRLWHNLREKMGITYGVFAFIDYSRIKRPFITYIQTHPTSVEKAIEESIKEMKNIKDGVTDRELSAAKSKIINRIPVNLSTNKEIADYLASIEFSGLGLDYINEYPKIITKLGKDDLKKAAEKYLHPDKLIIIIAGAEDKK